MTHTNTKPVLSTLLVAAALLMATPVAAQPYQHAARVEGAVGLILSSPHNDLYGTGGGVGLGYEFRLHDYVGIDAHYATFIFGSDDASVDFGSYHAPSVGARVHPLPDLDILDLYVSGRGALVFTGDETRVGVELDLGADFNVTDNIRVGPFVRYAHVFQPNSDNLGPPDGQYLAIGVAASMIFGIPEDEGPTDTDGDGLLDDEDGCPNEPEDRDEFEDADGCPDPDNDNDGVLDMDDSCPMNAEDADGFQDEDGCPDPDNDDDGIADGDDSCPLEAEDMDGDRDEDGCPEEAADQDNDQVVDADDQCVTEPEDRDGYEDEDGCPDPDNDQDTILDGDDECPLAPGSADNNGCPQTVRVEDGRIQILQRIEFRTNSARLMRRSVQILVEVAAVLNANAQIRSIRIEGHTDDRASEDSNLRLSQARAEAVRDWLVENGIATERLQPQGFGEGRPLVDNDTTENQRTNRRVEFVIVQSGTAQ